MRAGSSARSGFYPDAAHSAIERWPGGWSSIRTLGVRAEARRRGIGTALARECVRRSHARGAKSIGLHTAATWARRPAYTSGSAFAEPRSFDVEIGEMFTGRSLPPAESWQAQAYRLDLEEA